MMVIFVKYVEIIIKYYFYYLLYQLSIPQQRSLTSNHKAWDAYDSKHFCSQICGLARGSALLNWAL